MKTRAYLSGLVILSAFALAGCGHSNQGTNSGPTNTANQASASTGNQAVSNTANTANTATQTTGNATSGNATSTSVGNGSGTAGATTSNTTSSNSTVPGTNQVPATAQQVKMAATIQTLLNHPANPPVDCSALVQYVYAQAGIKVPRTVMEQVGAGSHVTNERALSYGDIVFYDLSSQSGAPTFDGIYVGNGQFVAQTGHGIETIQMNSTYWQGKFMFGEHVS